MAVGGKTESILKVNEEVFDETRLLKQAHSAVCCLASMKWCHEKWTKTKLQGVPSQLLYKESIYLSFCAEYF